MPKPPGGTRQSCGCVQKKYPGSIDNIIKVSKFAGMKPEEQDRYFREVMYEMDERDRLRTAHRRGVSEGEVRGIVKGKEDVAREMKAIGLPADVIIKCTGLTEDQIAAL